MIAQIPQSLLVFFKDQSLQGKKDDSPGNRGFLNLLEKLQGFFHKLPIGPSTPPVLKEEQEEEREALQSVLAALKTIFQHQTLDHNTLFVTGESLSSSSLTPVQRMNTEHGVASETKIVSANMQSAQTSEEQTLLSPFFPEYISSGGSLRERPDIVEETTMTLLLSRFRQGDVELESPLFSSRDTANPPLLGASSGSSEETDPLLIQQPAIASASRPAREASPRGDFSTATPSSSQLLREPPAQTSRPEIPLPSLSSPQMEEGGPTIAPSPKSPASPPLLGASSGSSEETDPPLIQQPAIASASRPAREVSPRGDFSTATSSSSQLLWGTPRQTSRPEIPLPSLPPLQTEETLKVDGIQISPETSLFTEQLRRSHISSSSTMPEGQVSDQLSASEEVFPAHTKIQDTFRDGSQRETAQDNLVIFPSSSPGERGSKTNNHSGSSLMASLLMPSDHREGTEKRWGLILPRNTVLLKLEPAELGSLVVQVRLTGKKNLEASFWTESSTVRTLLQAQLPSLNQVLTQQGFQPQQFFIASQEGFSNQLPSFAHQHSASHSFTSGHGQGWGERRRQEQSHELPYWLQKSEGLVDVVI